MCVQPAENSPTWWGTGSVEGGTGTGGITGATGLSLIEGPFQLPPPLDPVVLLTEVLEDLLCREQTKTRTKPVKTRTKYGQKWLLKAKPPAAATASISTPTFSTKEVEPFMDDET